MTNQLAQPASFLTFCAPSLTIDAGQMIKGKKTPVRVIKHSPPVSRGETAQICELIVQKKPTGETAFIFPCDQNGIVDAESLLGFQADNFKKYMGDKEGYTEEIHIIQVVAAHLDAWRAR